MIHDLSTQKGRNAYANSDVEKAKKVLLNKEEQKRLKLDADGNPIISKKVRNSIYKEALERSFTTDEYSSDTSCGLCYLLLKVVRSKNLDDVIDPYEACTEDSSGLPEYDLFITDSNPFVPFLEEAYVEPREERWDIRQLILMFCIEMTE